MKQRFFIFDVGRCFGCLGCVAACANVNETLEGVLWRSVHKLPPWDGESGTVYLSVSCNHCVDAPCAKGCPAKALVKRESDGIVIHIKEKCLGCRYCQMACPYGAIKWDEKAGAVSKCHFCFERLDADGEAVPACVETCFGEALHMELVELDDIPADFLNYAKESPGLKYIETVGPSIRFKGSFLKEKGKETYGNEERSKEENDKHG